MTGKVFSGAGVIETQCLYKPTLVSQAEKSSDLEKKESETASLVASN